VASFLHWYLLFFIHIVSYPFNYSVAGRRVFGQKEPQKVRFDQLADFFLSVLTYSTQSSLPPSIIMPPRRATRAASSTPSRAPPSAARPSSQGNTPGRTTALESTPLPDIEAEQSFAYGSSNTKVLPLQLVARKKMTIKQMAETLDAGIIQAERNFQAQREQANQYGMNLRDARAARAARRSSERESRESSVDSDQTSVPTTSRRGTALATEEPRGWLHDIEEETNSYEDGSALSQAGLPEEDDVEAESSHSSPSHASSSRTTLMPPRQIHRDQSSMPDVGLFDQTYNQERDLHLQGTMEPPTSAWDRVLSFFATVRDFFLMVFATVRGLFLMVFPTTRDFFLVLWDRTWWYFYTHPWQYFARKFWILLVVSGVVLTLSMCVFVVLNRTCLWYCETPWSLKPSRSWQHGANSVCKYAAPAKWVEMNLADDTPQAHAFVAQIANLRKQIKLQETLVDELQAKQSFTSATMTELTERQSELSKLHSDLQSKLAEVKASQAKSSAKSSKSPFPSSDSLAPIYKRINYASPSLGAAVDPYLTSPTQTRPMAMFQRLLVAIGSRTKNHSPPPIEALNPWTEPGDCWCAALKPHQQTDLATGLPGTIQLGILLSHEIFPDEILIEHLPLKTTPYPGTLPRDVEIWGDFSHLDQLAFAALLMGPHALTQVEWYPQLGLLGSVRYDPAANLQDGNFVQRFKLEYNQGYEGEFSVRKLVVRIKSTWGKGDVAETGAAMCLYRVRVHGVPVLPHEGNLSGNND
jgi:hypothetical protein